MTSILPPFYMIIGLVWILVSVYNYHRHITEDRKRQTNLFSFIVFCCVSPLVNIVFGMLLFVKWVRLGLVRKRTYTITNGLLEREGTKNDCEFVIGLICFYVCSSNAPKFDVSSVPIE